MIHWTLRAQLARAVRIGMFRRGWSTADLAFEAGIGEKHLIQILTCKADASLKLWEHLLDLSGIDLGVSVHPRAHAVPDPDAESKPA